MPIKLPSNPQQLRRVLALILAVVAVLVSTMAAAITYVMAVRHVERAAVEQVRRGLTHLDSPQMRSLIQSGAAASHAELRNFLEPEHFIGIRFHAQNGAVTAETWADGLDPGVLEAARAAQPRLGGDLLRLGNQAFVRVVRPVEGGDGASAEALYRLDPETVHTLDPAIRGAAFVAAMTALVTTLALYPVLLGLTRRSLWLAEDLLQSNLDLMRTLGSAIALRDADTDAHNYRVTLYSVRLAERIQLPPGDIAELIAGAFLHDVGKIGIPDAILLKPGPLSPDEFRIMQEHPLLGDRILMHNRWLGRARTVVRHHHERYDGSGYPGGLARENIPLAARLFAVADVFDALTTKRPYKPAFGLEQAAQVMRVEMAGKLDRRLLDVFLADAALLHREIGQAADRDLHAALAASVRRYYPAVTPAVATPR